MNSNNNDGAGGYFRVQDRLFDWYGQLLGPIAIAVYNYLTRCADKDGCCFPSYEDIARKVGISRRAALRAIAKLVKYKLITVKRRKHRQGHRDDYTSNCYKIRLEAFTHAGAHREVVSISHQVVSISHQVVSISHPKDYPLKDNPNKEKEREGEIPPSTPPDSPSIFSNSPQEGETSSAGEDRELGCQDRLEAFTDEDAHREVVSQGHPLVSQLGETTQKAEESHCPSDPLPAVGAATKANGKPTTGRERQHRGNGAGQPSPVSSLSDDEIEAAMQAIGWTEAQAKIEAPTFRDHHLRKATLSYDWHAELRIWKRRGDEWESREREHVRANGKVEKAAPRPPVVVAEPRVPIDPSKPRPSHMPMVLEEIARQERARRAAQP